MIETFIKFLSTLLIEIQKPREDAEAVGVKVQLIESDSLVWSPEEQDPEAVKTFPLWFSYSISLANYSLIIRF